MLFFQEGGKVIPVLIISVALSMLLYDAGLSTTAMNGCVGDIVHSSISGPALCGERSTINSINLTKEYIHILAVL